MQQIVAFEVASAYVAESVAANEGMSHHGVWKFQLIKPTYDVDPVGGDTT